MDLRLVELLQESFLVRLQVGRIRIDLPEDLDQGIHFTLQRVELIDHDNVLVFQQTMPTLERASLIPDLEIKSGKEVFKLAVQ